MLIKIIWRIKIQFDLGSDLHLSFEGLNFLSKAPNEGVKVLVLAGDIVEVELLKEKSEKRNRVGAYLQNLNDRYDKIIMVSGNHEHYGNSFIHTYQNLKTQFKKLNLTNFVLLEKEMYEYEDAIFFGATLWTTFRNGNPGSMWDAQLFMNDYKMIHVGPAAYGDKVYLRPEDTAAQCTLTKKRLMEFIDLQTDKKKILVTHMAPSAQSLDRDYANSCVNDAYYEEISNLLAYSDVKVAVHGHIHEPVDYMVENCRVVSNPRGYFSYEAQANNYTFLKVEV